MFDTHTDTESGRVYKTHIPKHIYIHVYVLCNYEAQAATASVHRSLLERHRRTFCCIFCMYVYMCLCCILCEVTNNNLLDVNPPHQHIEEWVIHLAAYVHCIYAMVPPEYIQINITSCTYIQYIYYIWKTSIYCVVILNTFKRV